MSKGVLQFILSVLIASPFVFAWAYVRPETMDLGATVIAGIVGLTVGLGSYLGARAILNLVGDGRD